MNRIPKQIIIDSMMRKINDAITEGSSENYFVAAVAATVTSKFVCYNSPYNGVKDRYIDDLYLLKALDEIDVDEYLHTKAGEDCYQSNDKSSEMVQFYATYYVDSTVLTTTKDFKLPAGYGGNMSYSEVKLGKYPIELHEDYIGKKVNVVIVSAEESLLIFHIEYSKSLPQIMMNSTIFQLKLLDISGVLPHPGVIQL